jgi:phosphonate transport system permease protein
MSREDVAPRSRALSASLPGLAIAAAIVWAVATTDIAWDRLGEAGPRIAEFLGRMVPPDTSVMPEVARGLAETMRIAILGTLGCMLGSLVLGPLASERLAPAWVHRPVRWFVTLAIAVVILLIEVANAALRRRVS